MNTQKEMIRKKIIFLIVNLIICVCLMLHFLSLNIMPIVIQYGEYECENLITKIANEVVKESIDEKVEYKIIEYNEKMMVLDFNVEIINSICVNVVAKMQYYLYELEKGKYNNPLFKKIGIFSEKNYYENGLIYNVRLSRVFNNALVGNLGISIPVRYSVIGKIDGTVISEIKEYGINNALIELKIKMRSKTQVVSPILSSERELELFVPLVVKLIQGDIPDSFYGSQILGDDNK